VITIALKFLYINCLLRMLSLFYSYLQYWWTYHIAAWTDHTVDKLQYSTSDKQTVSLQVSQQTIKRTVFRFYVFSQVRAVPLHITTVFSNSSTSRN